MSRLPDHNSNDLPIDGEIEKVVEKARDLGRPVAPALDSELDEESIEPTIVLSEPAEEDDDEFSLSQLSQAYAKLKRKEAEQATETTQPTEAGGQLEPGTSAKSKAQEQIDVTPSSPGAREARDNAGCPISPASIVEALVFVGLPGDEKLTLKKLSSLLRDVSPKEIKSIVQQLNERYENDQAAYRITLSGESISMELHESMLSFQRELGRQNKGVRLNAATIEVLAVIAYNQPLTREKIDGIRKKSSVAIVSQLVRRGLITPIAGERSLQKQRLITTEKFLNLFQLAELGDLPQGSDASDLDELLS